VRDRITRELMKTPRWQAIKHIKAQEKRANRLHRRLYAEWRERREEVQRKRRVKTDAEQYYKQEIRPAIRRLFDRREAKGKHGMDIELVSIHGFDCARTVISVGSVVNQTYKVSSQGEILTAYGTPLQRIPVGVNCGHGYPLYRPTLELLKQRIDNS
jgi:hypothetical protein